MNKTIYYCPARANNSNEKLNTLKKINEYFKLGYNIIEVLPSKVEPIRGNTKGYLFIDEFLNDKESEE